MTKTLHILNGDSTLDKFKVSGISGDTYVWKEVLSEGPVDTEFASDSFWHQRNEYMTRAFGLKTGEYFEVGQKPFQDMAQSVSEYSEIVLWFEYDLFCQINMIALIHWLNKADYKGTASLVCAGKIDGSDKLYALGEIKTEDYQKLFDSRLKIGSREFDYANDIYEVYTSNLPEDLFNFVLMPFAELPYLPAALESHFKRFPSVQTGLTEIEEQLIAFIQEGTLDRTKLIGKMLRWQESQGFGDLQYANILDRLKPLFEDFDTLKLKKAIDASLIDRRYYLGGANVNEWLWDQEQETLIPKEPAS